MKIVTKREEAEAGAMMLRKLKFMGKISAERVAQEGTVDFEKITYDAENILAVDDVIVGF